jgi:glycosyltransferase involved in cell wall biosynthesis
MPLVSAIIPSYNHEGYLRGAIRSVLGQEFDDFELIVVDDASSDGSRMIIEEFRGDPRVRIELHERNWGISPTFNQGLELARGRYVAYLGSDDFWLPGHLGGAVQILERTGAAMVYGRAMVVDAEGRNVTDAFGLFGSAPDAGFFEALIDRPNFVPFISVVMRRDAVRRVGAFDEQLVTLQDYDLWIRLSVGHEVRFRDAQTVAFRWDGRNTSAPTDANRERYTREFTHIMEKVMQEFPEEIRSRELAGELRRRIARHYVRMAKRSGDPCVRARLYRNAFGLNPKLRVAQRYAFSRLQSLLANGRGSEPNAPV